MITSILSMMFWCCAGTVAAMLSGLVPAIIAYLTSMPMLVMPFLGM